MTLADVRDHYVHLRALLHQLPGVELQSLNLMIAISQAPWQTLQCSMHELTQICRMSEQNSRRLLNHLSALGWVSIQIRASGETSYQRTYSGMHLLEKLLKIFNRPEQPTPPGKVGIGRRKV